MKSIFLTSLIFIFQILAFNQPKTKKEVNKFSCSCENKIAVRDYFEQYRIQQDFISKCELENEEKRKSLNLPKQIKISGFGPGPVSLVKPYYPKIAKQLRIFGEVLVEVFTDEKGFVIYSKILKGNGLLSESVRKAVCHSRFTPILYCGQPIKARWLIRYNFVLA